MRPPLRPPQPPGPLLWWAGHMPQEPENPRVYLPHFQNEGRVNATRTNKQKSRTGGSGPLRCNGKTTRHAAPSEPFFQGRSRLPVKLILVLRIARAGGGRRLEFSNPRSWVSWPLEQ